MRYSLVFELSATAALAALPEIPHELFTLACVDIVCDPHGPGGLTSEATGAMTNRTWAIGAMGFIEYVIDEDAAVVTVTKVLSIL